LGYILGDFLTKSSGHPACKYSFVSESNHYILTFLKIVDGILKTVITKRSNHQRSVAILEYGKTLQLLQNLITTSMKNIVHKCTL
jgi:hypothetical protein